MAILIQHHSIPNTGGDCTVTVGEAALQGPYSCTGSAPRSVARMNEDVLLVVLLRLLLHVTGSTAYIVVPVPLDCNTRGASD